jgi:hypothetical protein
VSEFSSEGRDTRNLHKERRPGAFITSDRAGGQGIDIWTSTRETLSDRWPPNIYRPAKFGQRRLRRRLPVAFTRRDETVFLLTRTDLGCGKRDIWYAAREKIHSRRNAIEAMVNSFNRVVARLTGNHELIPRTVAVEAPRHLWPAVLIQRC